MADTSNDIYNLYKECRECGHCCELAVLAMTVEEAKTIQEYIAENDIEAVDNGTNACPFRQEDMRCKIYPVRPKTCRLHNCSVPRHTLEANHPELDLPEDVPLIDMRMAFIHGEIIDPRTMSDEWVAEHFAV